MRNSELSLSDLKSVGVTLQIKPRLLSKPHHEIALLDADMVLHPAPVEVKSVRDGWQILVSSQQNSNSHFVMKGKPNRNDHGQTVLEDEHQVTIAVITDAKLDGGADDQAFIRLKTAQIEIDFMTDHGSDDHVPTLLAKMSERIVGRFQLLSSDVSKLSLEGCSDIDLVAATATCLDLHRYLASATDGESIIDELLTYFR